MRRILALTLLLVMLLPIAFAEEFDLTGMSLDELVALRTSIYDEINSRLENKDTTIGRGIYLVGVDIKAGSYEYVCGEIIEEDGRNGIWIFESAEDRKNGDYLYNFVEPSSGSVLYFSLKDGMIMNIQDMNGTINTDQKSWTP